MIHQNIILPKIHNAQKPFWTMVQKRKNHTACNP